MDAEALLRELDHGEGALRLTFSDAAPGQTDAAAKLTLRPLELRGRRCWQAESRRGAQAFHENFDAAEFDARVAALCAPYRQLSLLRAGESVTYTQYGRRLKKSVVPNDLAPADAPAHDREKRALLPEGEPIPALVDLGVFTQDYRLVRARADKYRQINRFLELIDDAVKENGGRALRILDFGCGKSYLTFILYYYLTVRRGLDVEIVGYDLKADVVENCNRIAEKYGYDRLRFLCGDVSRDAADDFGADMLLTLHACDTATDYALDYAIRNRVRYVFSVPCCQHEINLSLHRGGELDVFLRHGLIRERMSALLTDALRAEILERCGYEVDVIEFVDFAHTPKNLMLRATLRRPGAQPELAALEALRARYGFSQTLLALTQTRLAATPKLARPGGRAE